MRHRKKGRVLGRNPSHRKAMLRNMVKSLILTVDPKIDDLVDVSKDSRFRAPEVRGRIITTLAKAKEVQPMVEKCITIARRALKHEREAEKLKPDVEKNSQEWQQWRKSDQWRQWAQAMAPAVTARRRIVSLLAERGDKDDTGDKRVVRVLFQKLAPRFEHRQGGYTRILKLAKPRLGDAGRRAILEFVAEDYQRNAEEAAEAPAFEDTQDDLSSEDTDQPQGDQSPTEDKSTELTAANESQASQDQPEETKPDQAEAGEKKEESEATANAESDEADKSGDKK